MIYKYMLYWTWHNIWALYPKALFLTQTCCFFFYSWRLCFLFSHAIFSVHFFFVLYTLKSSSGIRFIIIVLYYVLLFPFMFCFLCNIFSSFLIYKIMWSLHNSDYKCIILFQLSFYLSKCVTLILSARSHLWLKWNVFSTIQDLAQWSITIFTH